MADGGGPGIATFLYDNGNLARLRSKHKGPRTESTNQDSQRDSPSFFLSHLERKIPVSKLRTWSGNICQ